MTGVYVCSLQPGAGKTALAAGLARKLQGQALGYLRLAGGAQVNADALFLSQATGAEVGPVVEANGALRQTYESLARGKHVVIMEGEGDLAQPSAQESCVRSMSATGAQALLVSRYSPGFSAASLLTVAQKLSPRLAGVVVNAIPQAKMPWATDTLAPELARAGVPVVGLLPEVWRLAGVSVGEIAEALGGELVTCPEAADEVVENLMVGAMSVDPAPHHLGRKLNKAIVTQANRVDIQLGALATDTACFILCGPEYPTPDILIETQNRGIPIVRVEGKILPALDRLETLFSQVRFHQAKKLPVWEQVLDQHFDFANLYSRLGLQ
ncbi:MAG: phosphotransacetylase family protein [Chloroflexi bacterium]|nr:phosphotransacetylase family protein [Chloroflexota bacterium]